ncbi:hypothetical protein [Acetobacter pasteurianus]|uniref:hypothetical protein n=1 Tax=Acetobacter TaxID=434 RepID=UPI000A9ECB26|nr:hypothetical protein [Acetobacter pasteurianus]
MSFGIDSTIEAALIQAAAILTASERSKKPTSVVESFFEKPKITEEFRRTLMELRDAYQAS